MNNARQWATAAGVVLAGALAGAIVGRVLGGTVLGAVGGVVAGMAINRRRECPVCMEHHARIQRLIAEG